MQPVEWLWETPRSARELADCAGLPADRLDATTKRADSAVRASGAERDQVVALLQRRPVPALLAPPGTPD